MCLHEAEDVVSPLAFARFRRFAHHPTCYRHDHHLVRVLGLELCLGCTGLSLGILTGFGIYFATDFFTSFQLFSIWIVGIILYLPTLAQPKVQFWSFKLISRILLGIAIFMMLFSLVLKIDWFSPKQIGIAIIGLAIFEITRRFTLRYRHSNKDDPCRDCPHGVHPFCLHHLDDLKALDSEKSGLKREFVEALVKQLESSGGNGDGPVTFKRL